MRDRLMKMASKQAPHNAPDNPGLWHHAVSEARKRFKIYPSAYANGWAAKWYKERGGGWHKEKQAAHSNPDGLKAEAETIYKYELPDGSPGYVVSPHTSGRTAKSMAHSDAFNDDYWRVLDDIDAGKIKNTPQLHQRMAHFMAAARGHAYVPPPLRYPMSAYSRKSGTVKKAEAVAKKDVGHGGLDEWFSGHGGSGHSAQWGDWVAISPVRKRLRSGRVVAPGDIVGPCGISHDPDWRDYTRGGNDPLKCMPRKKAEAMSKEERAALARGKARAERTTDNDGKPVMTRTFGKTASIPLWFGQDGENRYRLVRMLRHT